MVRLEQPVTIQPGEGWTAAFRDFEEPRLVRAMEPDEDALDSSGLFE